MIEVMHALYRLADYPILAALAAERTQASRLDGRACRAIYDAVLPDIDWQAVSEHELEFMRRLGVKECDPLVMFSRGLLTKNQAIEKSGLRDYAELLVAMGDADLPLPALPVEEIERQAALFAHLWGKS
jgi:hypothetical protein